MMLTRPREDQHTEFWPVFGDIALAMLLLFLLLLVMQVIESSNLDDFVIIRERKAEIKKLLEEKFGDNVTIRDEDRLSQRITFSSDVLFVECGAEIKHMKEEAGPLVLGVGEVLSDVSGYFAEIKVEGHTDLRAPKTSDRCPYESNWQLSSARATSVVRLLDQAGIEPEKLSAVGRSKFHPAKQVIDSLKTRPEHLSAVYRQNRRIEMILTYSEPASRHPQEQSTQW